MLAIVAASQDSAAVHAFDHRLPGRFRLIQRAADLSVLTPGSRVEFAADAEKLPELPAIREAARSLIEARGEDLARVSHLQNLAERAKRKLREDSWSGYSVHALTEAGKSPRLVLIRGERVRYNVWEDRITGEVRFGKTDRTPMQDAHYSERL